MFKHLYLTIELTLLSKRAIKQLNHRLLTIGQKY